MFQRMQRKIHPTMIFAAGIPVFLVGCNQELVKELAATAGNTFLSTFSVILAQVLADVILGPLAG